MDERQKHILALEQDASRLVDELSALKREVLSYKSATDELDIARIALAGFLEQTQALTQQTHNLIEVANAIGSAKIFEQLEAVHMALAEKEKKDSKRNTFLAIGLTVVIVAEMILIFLVKNGH